MKNVPLLTLFFLVVIYLPRHSNAQPLPCINSSTVINYGIPAFLVLGVYLLFSKYKRQKQRY